MGLRFSHQPRGAWFCPSCLARKKAAEEVEKRLAFGNTKRRRIEVDEEKYVLSSQKNDTLLLKVDAAEKQSREEMEKLMFVSKILTFSSTGVVIDPGNMKDFPRGLCRLRIAPDTFRCIQSLHRHIVDLLAEEARLTPWAGVAESDKRKRGYAFLPPSYGKFGKSPLTSAGVNFHAAEKRGGQAKKDEAANWHSCVHLREKDMTIEYRDALQAVVDIVRSAVADKYKSCLSLNNLHALQPNIHNGLDHLPGTLYLEYKF